MLSELFRNEITLKIPRTAHRNRFMGLVWHDSLVQICQIFPVIFGHEGFFRGHLYYDILAKALSPSLPEFNFLL